MKQLVVVDQTPSGLVGRRKPDLSTPERVATHLSHLFAMAGQNEFAAAIVPWFCDVCPSIRSREANASDMRGFFTHMHDHGILPKEVTGDHARLYKEVLTRASYTKSSIARVFSVLRGVYEQFGKKGLVNWDTVCDIQAVTSPKVDKNSTPSLSEAEAKKLLHARRPVGRGPWRMQRLATWNGPTATGI